LSISGKLQVSPRSLFNEIAIILPNGGLAMANTTLLNTDTATVSRRRSLSLPAWLVLICIVAFTALLAAGAVIWKNAPPVPEIVRSPQQ
jgi:hypothetical protein